MQITDLTSPNKLGLLQYWYTQSVTMDGPQGYGVYAQEVWAPKLVGQIADALGEIDGGLGMGKGGNGNIPTPVPEPSMTLILGILLGATILGLGLGRISWCWIERWILEPPEKKDKPERR